MSLTNLALKNSRLTILGILAVIIVGVAVYLSYPSAEDPSITIRSVMVTAANEGMSAEQVEELITKPLEDAMREVEGVDEILSTSKTGATKIEVVIRDQVTNLAQVFQDIRNKASDTKPKLPSGTLGPMVNDEYGLTAVATIALWTDGFSLAEMHDVADDIQDQIYILDGVKKVEFYGIQEERVYLEFLPAKLAQYGVSMEAIFGQLQQQNIIEPGGEIKAGDRAIQVEPSGNFESVGEIGDVVFTVPGTSQVARLEEVVDIKRSLVDPPEKPVFFNGHPAIILSVSTLEGTNNVEFGQRLNALKENIQQQLPIGYVLDYATFQPDLIETSVQGAVVNVYQTLAIVLTVVMIFLGLRTGLIVGSFVPLTMLAGIIVMRTLDIEFQRMSIAAMIIALGLLVDNGIVVAEDIRVRMEGGLERFKAAAEAGKTLAIPLLTSSLTTIFAFMPMLLIDGSAGEYVRSLGQVVTVLLLASWVLSMTVTPAMCAWFMKVNVKKSSNNKTEKAFQGRMYDIYRQALGMAFKFRMAFIAGLVVLLIGAIQVLGLVRTEFFPLGDRNQFLVYLDFEAGTDVRAVVNRIRPLTDWLADQSENPEITSHVAYVGDGGPRFFLALSPLDPDPHRAFILVNTKTPGDVQPLIERVNAYLDANIPEARADAKKMWFGSTEPAMLKIRLVGPDGNTLAERGARIMNAFYNVPGTVGIKQDWENKTLKLVVAVDQVRARRANVTSLEVAQALETTFAGLEVSDYREGDRVIPIVLRGEDSLRLSLDGIGRIQVYVSGTGEFISLLQVADIIPEWQFDRIQHKDQERTLTIEARNPALPARDLLKEIEPTLDGLALPEGYRFEIGGEIEDQREANEKLFYYMPFALLAIVVLLVGQFNSIRRGGIILLTIPLILIGGVVGLVVMHAAYGFMVLLGFYSLAGIVINNGIVLIDRIETERAGGGKALQAITNACLARLRPILMTTLTTVLGLIPLIVSGGALFYGMASVIAFGLIFATVFTLGFVPVLYSYFFKVPVKA